MGDAALIEVWFYCGPIVLAVGRVNRGFWECPRCGKAVHEAEDVHPGLR